MSRPLIVDAFCCQGGAAMGYWQAGFDVVGIDINPQPRYPFELIQGDFSEVLPALVAKRNVAALHGSPPCQLYSDAQRIQGREHPDLIGPFRDFALASGLPYVIENVEGARDWLIEPVMLCGGMFPGLMTYRHRLFESNVQFETPAHPAHSAPVRKMGRAPQEGDFMHVVGNFSGVEYAKRAMGIDWMTREGLRESIPPAYTEYLGFQLMDNLCRVNAGTERTA